MDIHGVIRFCHERSFEIFQRECHQLGRYALIPNAYAAEDLLKETVCSFHGLMMESQRGVELILLWEILACLAGEDIQDPFDPKLEYYFSFLAKYLDEIFFFGSLCTSNPPVITLELVKQNTIQLYERQAGACCEPLTPIRGIPQSRIKLAVGATKLLGLDSLFISLVHEMIHAFLQTFVYDRAQCSQDAINTVGLWSSRHGPTFRVLQFAILTSLRDQDYLDTIKPYHNEISRTLLHDYELAEEEHARDRIRKEGRRVEGYPPRTPNPNDPIRVYGGTVEIDIERLRASSHVYNKHYLPLGITGKK